MSWGLMGGGLRARRQWRLVAAMGAGLACAASVAPTPAGAEPWRITIGSRPLGEDGAPAADGTRPSVEGGALGAGTATSSAAAPAARPPTAVATSDVDPPTLYQRTFDADLIAHARIVHPAWEIPVGDPPVPWPVVEAQALEILKGDAAPGRLTFVRDGLETPPYAPDQEVLVFLYRVERSPGLAGLSVTQAVGWASPPGRVERVRLDPRTREAYLGAVRGYVAIGAMPASAAQLDRLRALTVDLIDSGIPPLAASAIRDLSLAGSLPLIAKTDMPRISRIVRDPRVAIETRVAILAELERRALIFGPTAWATLVRETRGPARLKVVRALAGRQSRAISQVLAGLLADPDPRLAAAAARALGSLGNHAAVEPLMRALARRDRRLRTVIVGALGAIRTQGARQALDLVAARHPDPQTRTLAAAAVIVLARRHGTTLAPMLRASDEGHAAARPGASARAAGH